MLTNTIYIIMFFIFFFFTSLYARNCFIVISFFRNFVLEQFNTVSFIFDNPSAIFCSTLCFIVIRVLIFASSYMETESNNKYFYLVLFSFALSIFCLINRFRPLIFFIGWDGLGLTSFWLIAWYSSSRHRNYRSLHTYFIMRLGDAFLLLYLASICFTGEAWLFPAFNYTNYLFLFFFLFASFTKRAQFPFISWLPLAMAAPTPISALVHSSTLVTAGVFLIYRCLSFVICIPQPVLNTIIIAGAFTALIGSVRSRLECDLKKCIAFSTLRHCGLIVIGLGLILLERVFFHLITHAILKSILFILAGWILYRHEGKQDIRLMNCSLLPTAGIASIMLNALNIISIPYLGIWYRKHMITGLGFSSITLSLFTLILTFFSYFYIVRIIHFSLFTKNESTITVVKQNKSLLFLMSHLMLVFCWLLYLPLHQSAYIDLINAIGFSIYLLFPFLIHFVFPLKDRWIRANFFLILTPLCLSNSTVVELRINSIPNFVFHNINFSPWLIGKRSGVR